MGQPASAPSLSLERLLTLVLALDENRPTAASALARRAGVSLRTIYRDVRRLQEAGVPIVSEPGRAGGLLLAPGFRLAPLGLTKGETIALSMAVQVLRGLPTLPFRDELESAARKVASAARVERPELLSDVRSWLRIEPPATDAFHPEREPAGPRPAEGAIGATVQTFVEALVAGRRVAIDYRSPYASASSSAAQVAAKVAAKVAAEVAGPPGAGRLVEFDPAGVVADRGLWYLVAFPRHTLRGARYLRADRVHGCRIGAPMNLERLARWRAGEARPWLREAMKLWIDAAPVVLEVSSAQAQRLARDWYFATGAFESVGGERVRFTWGEGEFERVRELIAWLGAPARLVAPAAWRAPLRVALQAHAALHADPEAGVPPPLARPDLPGRPGRPARPARRRSTAP
ncbi:MAG: WYL domain-containing protein [Rubrivivax sp.]|nr:WYL domain-containing protein [Rubrivivax sp.]